MADHPIPSGAVYVDLDQAAERLGVSYWTIRNRIADGSLPAMRIRKGRGIRVRLADVDALLVEFPAA